MQKKTDYKEIIKKFRKQQREEKKLTPEERIVLFDIWLSQVNTGREERYGNLLTKYAAERTAITLKD